MKYQVCRPLTPIEFEALKADIAENGVLVPVEVDENGDILDGHHRVQAWQELREEGVNVPQWAKLVRQGLTEEQKRNHARKLNVLRRQMTKDEREQLMIDMRHDGMSYRKIAEAVGVDPMTVHNTVKKSGVEISTPVIGADGKTYPAQQQPKASDERRFAWEFDTIDYRHSVFVPGNSVALDPVAAEATIKEIRQERIIARREGQQEERLATTVNVNSGVLHGDMRQLGENIATDSVDLILTDPPYPGEFLPLFSELSVFAARVLKPGGLCLVYSGQIFLPDVMSRLCTALEYAWTFAIRHSGGNQRIFKVNVNTGWKPVIALYKPPLTIWWDSFIDVVSGGREKELHEWQQAESEAAFFIEHLTLPGQVVIDPFCGSGTVLKAAKDLGRQYQGFELSAEHVQRAIRRLA